MAASATSSKENQQICCLKECNEDPEIKCIAKDAGKVEVKSFEPKKEGEKLLVNWEKDGSAMFHSACWNNLVKATKGDGSLSSTLSEVEKTMILDANKTAEFHDAESAIMNEAARIAAIFKRCQHCIAFTGAGISTAAGIGDFRGKDGAWTNRDKLKKYGASSSIAKSKLANRAATIEKLRPTYTHEALHKLVELGYLKFIISQNVDGLHRLSGISKEKIAELHGNSFKERCEDCGNVKELKHHYMHGKKEIGSYASEEKCSRCKISHWTGRKCAQPGCGGSLMNTVINFGDYLDADVMDSAEHHAKMADAVLALGSSLKVSPANDFVTMGQEPHRLIICNRQSTPYDNECKERGADGEPLGARVFCDCDKLMKKVMEQLLSPTDLRQWEGDRDSRMAEYDMKRTVEYDMKRLSV